MQNISRHLLAAAVLTIALTSAGNVANAQTVIASLPYTITAGGTYVLNSNLGSTASTGNLITINASNVTIDFQNHYITGPAASLTTTSLIGIYAQERSNLTIRNGTVAYCSTGIYISGNGSATTNNVDQQITNMRVTFCDLFGIYIEDALASVISACQVSQIGTASSLYAYGIDVDGAGVVVQGCTVSHLTNANGIYAYGISSDSGSFTRQCQVTGCYYGIVSGIYQDNLASRVTSAFSGGTDGGGNVDDGTTYPAGAAGAGQQTSAKPRIRPL